MSTTLIVNPRDDTAFADLVRAIEADGVGSPAEFQHRLRARYPDAVVRLRELHGEPFTVWYVYRDGHWTPGTINPEGVGDDGGRG